MSSSSDRNWALGIFFLVLVAALWAGSSVLIQYIYDNLDYEEPFVLTYIGTSLFFIYIPGWFILTWLGQVKNPRYRQLPLSNLEDCWDSQYEMVPLDETLLRRNRFDSDTDINSDVETKQPNVYNNNDDILSNNISSSNGSFDDLNSPIIENETDYGKEQTFNHINNDDEENKPTHIMSHYGTMRVSLIVCPIWFLANWTYNQSLSMTSVTSSTIISTTSTLFSFILSVMFTGEKYTFIKLIGVFCCMGGTFMVAFGDQEYGNSKQPTHEFAGDLIALFSAIAYSCYTVVIKKFVPNDDVIAMPLLFGYLGLFNIILLAPILLLLFILTKGSIFHHFSPRVFGLICAEGIFDDVLSDYLWARAVVLTTPTIATVGLSLTIPLAFISDAFFHNIFPTPLSTCGALAVVSGFILVNIGDGSCETRCRYLLRKMKLVS